MSNTRSTRLTALAVLYVAAAISLSGCVRRRMTVRTDPPGAMVYVDKRPIGISPVSTSFVYYGAREFEVVKDGYRTEQFLRRFNPPWYELPGLAFISETLVPYEFRDERVLDVQMTPEVYQSTQQIIDTAQQLRQQSQLGVAIEPPR